ncbi:helix-turn-helix domain-containing protein [Desemzia sp. C1]|uniref:Helix-turn-helix n=1 Tax=Desemzia incerta TaxID=82801 RepID=A0A1I5Y414_9LACT|nr:MULTISPECIES: helix-turn-helix transcriptional regulator [Desemzia]MCI3028266.1 helix-turn-helix domain-containing protein [Desemzia sp. C1]SFQ38687.1 Helix-turn-helix [Desemzia incerta]
MKIGDKIKEERLRKEWTQEQLAQLLNVSRSTVSSWEVARNYPDLETIVAISDLFGISLDRLLREDKQMAKDTTKKLKRGQLYKYALIALSIIVLLYFGYNAKLRLDEHTYRSNLEEYGWENIQSSSPAQSKDESNAYELAENDITYKSHLLTAEDSIGFPLPEQNISVITTKDDFVVDVSYENEIGVSISPENDQTVSKQFYVTVDRNGNLAESDSSWSEDERQAILNYLSTYQDTHQELIDKTLEKISEITGK